MLTIVFDTEDCHWLLALLNRPVFLQRDVELFQHDQWCTIAMTNGAPLPWPRVRHYHDQWCANNSILKAAFPKQARQLYLKHNLFVQFCYYLKWSCLWNGKVLNCMTFLLITFWLECSQHDWFTATTCCTYLQLLTQWHWWHTQFSGDTY